MTMILQDSAAGLPASKWTTVGGSANPTAGAGPFGDYAYVTASSQQLARGVPAQTSYVVGFRYYTGTPGSTQTLTAFQDGATTQVDLRRAADGTLSVTRNGTQLAATSAGFLASNRWYKIDFDATIHPTTGAFTVHADDVAAPWATGAGSGQNTRATATSQITNVTLPASSIRYAHIYLNDKTGSTNNGRLAGFRCDALVLDGDGVVQGVSSGGGASTYTNLTDASDATYNELLTGQKDTHTVANPVSTLGAVYAVSVSPRWYATDSGTATARVGVDSGGTLGAGATLSPPTAVADDRQQIFETDPATGSAWLAAAVSAVKAFVEKLT